ncbi:unnamed protein product [Gongylonema pulchrum]|uniref:Twinfilin-1 n=1 Tax=Gongylonema pulchrum TaxID=637853 RepID=A0A183DVA4_9BILA|nr:unnamed protein product [Gongylonema pulchrum]
MACQSGIREELCVNFQDKGTADWRADFKRYLPDCIDAFEPCYVLFRIGDVSDVISSKLNTVICSFADDRAPVREKMVFAATRATFKSEFGQSNIRFLDFVNCYSKKFRHEYHVTNKKEMTLEAFERWIFGKEEPGPMSELEKEMHCAQKEQKTVMPASQTVKGVFFPVDQDAEEELRKLANHEINYVQLAVDTLNEAIKLESSRILNSADELKEVIPRDKPRYHFFRFSHKFDNEDYNTLLFIYSMPSSGCTIKERMLYSSCKQPFLQSASTTANLHPDKKIEIDSKENLSSDILLDYTHPSSQSHVKGFARPPGPVQRGTRRVTKTAVG